jgi:hypothetical protein
MPITKDDREQYRQLRGVWRKQPELYVRHRLGLNPTGQQRELLSAISPSGAKVSARAGHGVGKSGATSGIILWHLECFDYSRIVATAPSASQLYSVLWAELAKWIRRGDEKAKADGLPSELWLSSLFGVTQDRVYDKGAPTEWFAVARTSRKENPDALQGFHASDVDISADGNAAIQRSDGGGSILFVIEEASGVPDVIFEVAEGALSSPGARLLMIGNPTRNTGFFARSHKQDRSSYKTLHFSCSDSPLVDKGYRASLVKKYGENSNIVRVRADGEFPKQDDDVLIPLEAAEAALTREPRPSTGKRILGVDVARYGDDRTVFVLRAGTTIEHIEIASKQDTMVTAGRAVALRRELNADAIHVDVIGVGAGVVDRLKEVKQPVVAVNVAEAAPERRKSKIDAQGLRLRDHLWLEMRDWLADEEPSFVGAEGEHAQDLAGELASVKYKFDSSGRIVVESKDEMKARGLRSPDIADALATTFAPGGGRLTISDAALANIKRRRR